MISKGYVNAKTQLEIDGVRCLLGDVEEQLAVGRQTLVPPSEPEDLFDELDSEDPFDESRLPRITPREARPKPKLWLLHILCCIWCCITTLTAVASVLPPSFWEGWGTDDQEVAFNPVEDNDYSTQYETADDDSDAETIADDPVADDEYDEPVVVETTGRKAPAGNFNHVFNDESAPIDGGADEESGVVAADDDQEIVVNDPLDAEETIVAEDAADVEEEPALDEKKASESRDSKLADKPESADDFADAFFSEDVESVDGTGDRVNLTISKPGEFQDALKRAANAGGTIVLKKNRRPYELREAVHIKKAVTIKSESNNPSDVTIGLAISEIGSTEGAIHVSRDSLKISGARLAFYYKKEPFGEHSLLTVFSGGKVRAENCIFDGANMKNCRGVTIKDPNSTLSLVGSTVENCETGVFAIRNANVDASSKTTFSKNGTAVNISEGAGIDLEDADFNENKTVAQLETDSRGTIKNCRLVKNENAFQGPGSSGKNVKIEKNEITEK